MAYEVFRNIIDRLQKLEVNYDKMNKQQDEKAVMNNYTTEIDKLTLNDTKFTTQLNEVKAQLNKYIVDANEARKVTEKNILLKVTSLFEEKAKELQQPVNQLQQQIAEIQQQKVSEPLVDANEVTEQNILSKVTTIIEEKEKDLQQVQVQMDQMQQQIAEIQQQKVSEPFVDANEVTEQNILSKVTCLFEEKVKELQQPILQVQIQMEQMLHQIEEIQQQNVDDPSVTSTSGQSKKKKISLTLE